MHRPYPVLQLICRGLPLTFVAKIISFWITKRLPGKKNWVLAHELGHILLGHLRADPAERNESPCGEVVYRELLADVFSTVLIALCAYGALDNNTEGKENKNGH